MIIRIAALLSFLFFMPWSLAKTGIADPTRPPGYQEKNREIVADIPHSTTEHPEWTVNSIIISPTDKLVIINGKQLRIGDEIAGAKILDISFQQVTLRYQSKKITLSLHKTFISEINARP